MLRQKVIYVLLAVSLIAGAGFATLWFQHYARWISRFDARGTYFDPDTGLVYSEQSGIGWAVLFLFAAIIALICIYRIIKNKNAARPK